MTSPIRSTNRRTFLQSSSASLAAGLFVGHSYASQQSGNLHVAPFRFDVTPPMGHSLCGGWIKPVVGVDDPLEAIGYVLTGIGKPIVVCSVDWTGLLNSAHVQWRQVLAEAAGTTIDRVAVQCVHQHNAPFACLDAEEIISEFSELPHIVEVDFYRRCLDAGRDAVRMAMKQLQPVTQIATGQAKVEKVAGNRRILGPNGKVVSQRGSSSKNSEHHKLPEGLIDPFLKTVALYSGDQKVVASHYYACHPMSYYGDGMVSADFCGQARRLRQQQDPECTHLYFNGCGGNIGAGKYNDGTPQMRPVLRDRILKAIVQSEQSLKPETIHAADWRTEDILPPSDRERFDEAKIMQQISDSSQRVVARNRPSYTVAWLRREQAGLPITLSSLHLNQTSTLHLPSECFIEYQLLAQRSAADRFVACAAYGDGGPWYIPTAEAYPQGGYAVSVAWCAPDIERILSGGIRELLKV